MKSFFQILLISTFLMSFVPISSIVLAQGSRSNAAIVGALIGSAIILKNQRLPLKLPVATRDAQKYLNMLGYNVGEQDGIAGRFTHTAIADFQRSRGSNWNGVFTVQDFQRLRTAALNSERNLTPKEILEIQKNLNFLGLPVGQIDGIIGARTSRSISQFRIVAGMPIKGFANRDDLIVTRVYVSNNGKKAIGVLPTFGTTVVASAVPTSSFLRSPLPTRAFSGPSQFPPKGYRGYGIIVFKSKAAPSDKERHQMICEAYISSLPQTATVVEKKTNQFLTVWPVKSHLAAKSLNEHAQSNTKLVCEFAIEQYDLLTGIYAIKAAEKSGFDDQGIGPFLLAWSPASSYGGDDSFVLSLDLSSVNNYEQALGPVDVQDSQMG